MVFSQKSLDFEKKYFQTSTTSTLLATVEPAMTTTAACAGGNLFISYFLKEKILISSQEGNLSKRILFPVERRMQAMAVWPSPPGAISTLSTPSTR